MDLLKQNVAKHIQLSIDEMELFCRPFVLKEVKKKQYLLKEGEVCRFEAFVTKGCFKIKQGIGNFQK